MRRLAGGRAMTDERSFVAPVWLRILKSSPINVTEDERSSLSEANRKSVNDTPSEVKKEIQKSRYRGGTRER